jgi:cell division protein FtsI/penicillin-binding protein 2
MSPRRAVTSVPRAVAPGQLRRTLVAVRRFRTNFLFGTVLLLFVLLLGRLGKLQLVDAAQFQAEAAAKHASAYRFQPRRGRILDRNAQALAVPRSARRVGLDPTQIDDPRTFALLLSDALGGALTPRSVRDALLAAHAWARAKRRPLPQYRVLLPYVDEPGLITRLDEVRRMSIREKRRAGIYGVVIDMEEGRRYPNGDYAAHVLGQVPAEGCGTGAEHAFTDSLSGRAQEVALQRDGRRRPYLESGSLDLSDCRGEDVRLSIDITIQHFVESALTRLVERWSPTVACGMVLDPHTGEILALANRPTFDPNESAANQNVAIQGLFEPGSFFKPFTVAWALQYAVVGPDDTIDMPERIQLPSDPHPIRDTHLVGPGDVRTLLAQSSNTGAAQLAHRLGPERMHALFEHLFPARAGGTGCGLPYEKCGGPRLGKWPWWLAHRAGFGQGFHVTPMQMIAAFSAFARSDGRQVRPTITPAAPDDPRVGVRVCDPLHLPVIRQGLERCASEGTARRVFADASYAVGAKTATAQQWGTRDGEPCRYNNCSVAAYAPADRPQVVVLVLAQVPVGSDTYGGTVAGPAVRSVLERTLHYWKVPPRRTEPLLVPAPAPAAPGGALLVPARAGGGTR